MLCCLLFHRRWLGRHWLGLHWGLLLWLLRSLLGAVCDDIDTVSVVEAVELWGFVQEGEVPVCSYPRLTFSKVIVGLGQP